MKLKERDCKPSGWFFVRFKCLLSKSEREQQKYATTFEDWAYFDGSDWDIEDYRKSGFYVLEIIKSELEQTRHDIPSR